MKKNSILNKRFKSLDDGVRDFVRASVMDNLFAGGSPVMGVDRLRCSQPVAFNILMDMLRSMTARGESFVSEMRAFFKTDITVFVNTWTPLQFPYVTGK